MFKKMNESVNEGTHYENARSNMQQFAIFIPNPIDQYNPAITLNKWCMEHNCYPLSFKVDNKWIYAIVRQN